MRALQTIAALLLTVSASAQIPNTLLHSIPAPPVGAQKYGMLGSSVAVDVGSGLTVAGVPFDDLGAYDSGVVKVFDSATGALLHLIPNPSPAENDNFGHSVAISGTRVVIGAPYDHTAAINAGSVYVYDLNSSDPSVPMHTLCSPNPVAGSNFGQSVAVSGTRVVVGAFKGHAGAEDAKSAYVYDLTHGTPTVPVYELDTPSSAQSDYFGPSVAISGTRVVVGVPNDDTGAADAGSAYVYDLTSGTPSSPVHALSNPSPAAGDGFGYSVAISSTRIVVGAYGDDTGAWDAGSAYVYDLTSGTPTSPMHTLNNPSPAGGDLFSYSVAISGTRVVVGAHGEDAGAEDAGSVYVYDLNNGIPAVPVHTLSKPSPVWGDSFGTSVAVSGTVVAVGTPYDDTGAEDAGSVFVYLLSSGTPTVPLASLNNPSPASGDQFGISVAVSGTRVVVGAFFEATGAEDTGSVYVYDLNSSTPAVPVHTLNNPSPAPGDGFGFSVAISGTRVVVGAYTDDNGASDAGSVYVYDLSSGTPTVPLHTLNNPSPMTLDFFGYSVAVSGTWVVVGALSDDTAGNNTGIVYVYDLTRGTATAPLYTINNPSPVEHDLFGCSVAVSGTQVVVGANADDTGASDTGSAYVYDLNSGTPTTPSYTLNNPNPAPGDSFGQSVAISGTRVAVGAPYGDTGVFDAGSSYIYDLTSGTPTIPIATLNSPSPVINSQFGNSVAISGTRVVVGAYFNNMGAENVGSAYVYDLDSGTPTVPVATLNNPSPADEDVFGYSVALDGTTVAIGAHFDDTIAYQKGSAYIFGPHSLDHDSDGLLDSWELTYWPTTTGHGPLDDDDKDSIVNLLELAFGLNPTQGNGSPLPPAVNEGGYLTLTLTKRPGVTYEVQSAGTLLPALPESFSAASTTVLLDNTTTLKVRDNVLMSAPGGRFMRVKVTAAP